MPARSYAVPLGAPALLGLAGLSAVVATGGQTWQLLVSAMLALFLFAVDARRAWTAARS